MDFFAHQDKARKHTTVLVIYFVIAVLCIIASVYVASLLIFYGAGAKQATGAPPPELVLWDPQLFLYVVLGTLGVVIIGSLYKTATLSKGGSAVAESLGGRLVNPNTNHPDERKLRNVIEEMAIAAGVPVPKIYVLDDEQGINAFAAGHAPGDAAIGVTRGCMTLLNRDELQGVIGHEFSHILNGDMRLNLRIMGILFGILCLAVIGRVLIYSRGGRDRNPLMFLGLALIVIGAIGVFFGRLIQAALSRQREFLADASSVQFTRNPVGLSGALQKIGGVGSQVESAHAGEASHMFFENGMGKPFLGALATHPPLGERIRAIDPAWDGKFKAASSKPVAAESSRVRANPGSSRSPFPTIPGMPAAGATDGGFATNAVLMGAVLPSVGKPTPLHLDYAKALWNSFSEKVQAAAREPLDAIALVYAMLLSPDDALRAKQLTELAQQAAADVGETTATLWPEVAPIASRARLPLVNLALPALRQLRPDEFEQFSQTLDWLIESDGQIELFEFVLQKIVRRHLASQSGATRPTSVQFHTLKPLVRDCSVVLSALANASSSNAAEVARAFRAGAPHLGAKADALQLLPRTESGLKQLDTALDRLALGAPQIKKNLIEAGVQIVGADGLLQEREAELLRAIADTLDCPIPPFVADSEATGDAS
ncbi:MAG: M48 family metalloprotease [Planctomycetales bacterium]|nr:M48 family metalloprotease [Planctomycetales bacterium]